MAASCLVAVPRNCRLGHRPNSEGRLAFGRSVQAPWCLLPLRGPAPAFPGLQSGSGSYHRRREYGGRFPRTFVPRGGQRLRAHDANGRRRDSQLLKNICAPKRLQLQQQHVQVQRLIKFRGHRNMSGHSCFGPGGRPGHPCFGRSPRKILTVTVYHYQDMYASRVLPVASLQPTAFYQRVVRWHDTQQPGVPPQQL